MRELSINGYIADEQWFEDEITPAMLHSMLYDPTANANEEVHITLNSYGGSCNAATQMYDELIKYPGGVNITISGTAASAATVIAQACKRLTMTVGSLFMIHDPSTLAFGNEKDMMDTINVLKTVKQTILNMYQNRCKKKTRDEIAQMMTNTTWMDANAALENGFIDEIENPAPAVGNVLNSVDRNSAETLVNQWKERRVVNRASKPVQNENKVTVSENEQTEIVADVVEETTVENTVNENTPVEENKESENFVSVQALDKRLELLKHQIDF